MKAAAIGSICAVLTPLFLPCFAACTTKHAPKPSEDSGANLDAGGDGGFIRRRDGQTTSGDPVPTCQRFDPMPCAAGQQCRLVIRRAADAGSFLIYPGCVEGISGRPLGAPCDPWGGQAQIYAAAGLQDEVYVDPCEPGLYCASDFKIRGHYTCQRSCQSRASAQSPAVRCPSPTQYCAATSSGATSLEEVCRASDVCDPTSPTSCGTAKGCYLRLNDTGTGVLTVCLPVAATPIDDGLVCQSLNDCHPGSSCWAPTRLPPARWTATDLRCRRTCTTSTALAAGQDAGDEDGGSTTPGSNGVCSAAAASCVAFASSGLDFSTVKATLGQCE